MAQKKETEDKVIIRSFKDGSKNWWVGNLHYTLLNGKLICAAGGIETEELREKMMKYLKTKKISFEQHTT